jgi:hypothetical protein
MQDCAAAAHQFVFQYITGRTSILAAIEVKLEEKPKEKNRSSGLKAEATDEVTKIVTTFTPEQVKYFQDPVKGRELIELLQKSAPTRPQLVSDLLAEHNLIIKDTTTGLSGYTAVFEALQSFDKAQEEGKESEAERKKRELTQQKRVENKRKRDEMQVKIEEADRAAKKAKAEMAALEEEEEDQ